jgi:hypothetical protein
MVPKILHWIGLTACIILIVSCFMPWAYYADATITEEAQRTFTGFYSYGNNYGRPGKMLVAIGVVVFILMLLPKIWAKRTNLFVCALGVGYAVKTYILFVSCYNAYCPEKKGWYIFNVDCLGSNVGFIGISKSYFERYRKHETGINPVSW